MQDARLSGTLDRDPRSSLAIGSPVEVRNRFCSAWSGGFEVAEATGDRYRVRRRSDRYVLPAEFGPSELRRPADRTFPSPGGSVSAP